MLGHEDCEEGTVAVEEVAVKEEEDEVLVVVGGRESSLGKVKSV